MQVTHISSVGGSLQIRKEDVRADVFKPTVALPTMTVEEFGEIELERARERQVIDWWGFCSIAFDSIVHQFSIVC